MTMRNVILSAMLAATVTVGPAALAQTGNAAPRLDGVPGAAGTVIYNAPATLPSRESASVGSSLMLDGVPTVGGAAKVNAPAELPLGAPAIVGTSPMLDGVPNVGAPARR